MNCDFIVPWGTDKVFWLIYKQVDSVLKEFNVHRHYETSHKAYDKFSGEEHKHKIKHLCAFFLCGPQSHAGSLNWHSVIKTLRTPGLQDPVGHSVVCFDLKEKSNI